jgi:hypothetical protein
MHTPKPRQEGRTAHVWSSSFSICRQNYYSDAYQSCYLDLLDVEIVPLESPNPACMYVCMYVCVCVCLQPLIFMQGMDLEYAQVRSQSLRIAHYSLGTRQGSRIRINTQANLRILLHSALHTRL